MRQRLEIANHVLQQAVNSELLQLFAGECGDCKR